MGYYYGLRFTADLTPQGAAVIEELNALHDWSLVRAMQVDHRFLSDWRCNFIPFGAVMYMPSEWINENKLENGRWTVCCSLKDRNTIEAFLLHVLTRIVREACQVEIRPEDDTSFYHLTVPNKRWQNDRQQ